MAKTISDGIRELCLGLPDSEEVLSHGSPSFKAGGKSFAIYTVNHHGNGRVALYVNAPAGAQQLYTEMEPDYYFVPPYVGPKGWLGIELNKNLDWVTIANRVREAWDNTVPAALAKTLGDTPYIQPPSEKMTAEQIDPFLRPRARKVMGRLATICEALPETSLATQFGNPVYKAGKKTFVSSHCYKGRLNLQFWVGADQQSMLCYDERYAIPAYMGYNGWVELDVEQHCDWAEIESLLMTSYRHFALKRMLKALEPD